MKKLIGIFSALAVVGVILFTLVIPHSAYGTTRYIAQSAGSFSGGTACNGQPAVTPATFNGVTNSPGDVNYICGTITGGAGSQLLTPKGNGTASSPVKIVFDTGAILQAPYFAPNPNGGCGGAICLYGLSYYTVDGQNTGTIQNTANGSGLAYQQTTEAIEGYNCTGCTIKNLTIANMYVHSSASDTSVDQTGARCISFNGSNWLISGNTMHDAGWCLFNNYNNGDSNVEITGNTIFNIDHGWMLATQTAGGNSGPFLFHGNTVYGYAVWDTSSDDYHHDGIHCYTSQSNGSAAHISSLAIYDNLFNGPVGANVTAHIFLEGGSGSGSTPCADATSGIQIFNNVAIGDQGVGNGLFGLFSGNYTASSGGGVYNNTLMSNDSNSDSSNVCFSANSDVSGMTFENNALSGCNQLIAITDGIKFTANYNQYGNGGSNAFVCNGSYLTSSQFSSWQSCIGGEANSAYSASLNLGGNGAPQAGSSLIGSGTNLSSLCTGALSLLCTDKSGSPRASTGPWNVGAFSSSGPQPPTGVTGTAVAK